MAAGYAAPASAFSSGSPLDGPPPSPTTMSTPAPGSPFGMKGLAPGGGSPAVSSNQMPPEVLTGITQAAQTVSATLKSFAQVTPDKAAALDMIQQLLQQYLADIMVAGAGPVSPTAPGSTAPQGGIDRGVAGPGTV